MDTRLDMVDIHQAAKSLEVSVDALRKRISRGQIEAEKREGRWFVQALDNVQPDSPDGPDSVQAVQTEGGPGPDSTVDGVELALGAMEARIASLEAQLVSKDHHIEELLIVVRQAQAALPAPKGRPWWRLW